MIAGIDIGGTKVAVGLVDSHGKVLSSQESPTGYDCEYTRGLEIPDNLPWVSIYWIFTASSFGMVIWLLLSKFPKVERTKDERAGPWDMYLSLARKRVVCPRLCDGSCLQI